MKICIKKVAIVIIAVTMSAALSAQEKGDMAAGLNVVAGLGKDGKDIYAMLGVGAKFQYNVTDPFRMEGSLTIFPEQDYTDLAWDLSLNAHWLIPVVEKISAYPLTGFGLFGTGATYRGETHIDNRLGINIGGGADFRLTDWLILNAELKYKFVFVEGENTGRPYISVGAAYKF